MLFCSKSRFGDSRALPLVIILLMASWPVLLSFIFSEYPQTLLPTVLDQLLGYFSVLALTMIKSPLLRIAGYTWVAWYFVGTLNVISSSLILGDYYSSLDITEAARIYLGGCLAFVLGLLAFERAYLSKGRELSIVLRTTSVYGITKLALLIFPVLWIGSMYQTLGYIPVLSGHDITDEMYETNYGLLYPYTIILVLSSLYALHLHLAARLTRFGFYYSFLVILLSFADGKRVVAMVFMFASMPMLFRYYGRNAWRYLGLVCAALISLYVLVMFARTGGKQDKILLDGIAAFMAIGVEFRDFVYTTNYYSPGEVPGYSWFLSALAAMGNNFMLSLLGVDKAELVHMGSAYAWSDMFRSPFGIRTGIVSEVWFAYGILSFLILFVTGLLTGYVVKKIYKSRSELDLIFWSATFGLLLLSVVGQTTAITGSFIVFVYVYIAVLVERALVHARSRANIGECTDNRKRT